MMRKRISLKAREALFMEHRGICHICGGQIQVGQSWEVEHIIAVGLGGPDELENMAPAHQKCHVTKTTKADVPAIAKAKRLARKHRGIKKERTIRAWRKFDGTPVYK